jgi:hypothetical protein
MNTIKKTLLGITLVLTVGVAYPLDKSTPKALKTCHDGKKAIGRQIRFIRNFKRLRPLIVTRAKLADMIKASPWCKLVKPKGKHGGNHMVVLHYNSKGIVGKQYKFNWEDTKRINPDRARYRTCAAPYDVSVLKQEIKLLKAMPDGNFKGVCVLTAGNFNF